jgi:hypothetical protein
MQFSRNLARDMKHLHLTGFHGVMSDQTQRATFPTGLPNAMQGEFQFDSSADVEAYIDSYMHVSFGTDWQAAKNYLDGITQLFAVDSLAQKTDVTSQDTGAADNNSKKADIFSNEAAGKSIAQVPVYVDAFADTVAKNLQVSDPCHRESWRILVYHGEYCKLVADIYVALSKNDVDGANAALATAIDRLSELEPEIHYYFDLVLFNQRMSQIIAGR